LAYTLAPAPLAAGSYVLSALLLALCYYALRGSRAAINVSTALAVISIVVSPLIPAHRGALLGFGSSSLLDALDALQVLGFYVFPAAFLLLRLYVALRSGGRHVAAGGGRSGSAAQASGADA